MKHALPMDLKMVIKVLKKDPAKRTFDQNKLLTEQVVSKIKTLKEFNKNFGQLCVQSLSYQRSDKGTVLFKQNQDPNRFYIILKGKVGLWREKEEGEEGKGDRKAQEWLGKESSRGEVAEQLEEVVGRPVRLQAVLGGEDSVGESEFMRDRRHGEWSVCLEECDLALVSKQLLQASISDDQQSKATKLNALEFLLNMPLLAELSEVQVREIYFNSLLKGVRQDQSVYNKNDYAYNFYIVKEGVFGIYKEFSSNYIEQLDNFQVRPERNQRQGIFQQPEQCLLQQFTKNAFFGQRELLTQEPRQHSVQCLSPEGGTLILINRQFFSRLVNNQQANIQYLLLPKIQRSTQKLADLEQQAFYQYRVKQSQNQLQVQQTLKQKLAHMGGGHKRHRVQKSCIQIKVEPKSNDQSTVSQSINVNLPRIDQKSQFKKLPPFQDTKKQLASLIMVNHTSPRSEYDLLQEYTHSANSRAVRKLDYSDIHVEKY